MIINVRPATSSSTFTVWHGNTLQGNPLVFYYDPFTSTIVDVVPAGTDPSKDPVDHGTARFYAWEGPAHSSIDEYLPAIYKDTSDINYVLIRVLEDNITVHTDGFIEGDDLSNIDWGDGTDNKISVISHTYHHAGIYQVTLTACDSSDYVFNTKDAHCQVLYVHFPSLKFIARDLANTAYSLLPEGMFLSTYETAGNKTSVFSEQKGLEYLASETVLKGPADYTFFQCERLKSIGKLDTSSMTSCLGLFSNCESLEYLPSFDTSHIVEDGKKAEQHIQGLTGRGSDGSGSGGLFYNCARLKTAPLLNTSRITIFDDLFYKCASLYAVPLYDTSQGISFTSMFSGCESLREIPKLDISKGLNLEYMFKGCKELTSLPELEVSNAQSANYMFKGCIKLSHLEGTWKFKSSVDFSDCPLDDETIDMIINNLQPYTGDESPTIIFQNAISDDLTSIAVDEKGWIVAHNN